MSQDSKLYSKNISKIPKHWNRVKNDCGALMTVRRFFFDDCKTLDFKIPGNIDIQKYYFRKRISFKEKNNFGCQYCQES